MSQGWKKEWLRLKVDKESEKGEKLGKRKCKRCKKWGKRREKGKNLGSKPT